MGTILKEDINNISDCPENALSVVDGDICCIKWNGQPIVPTEKCALNT